VLHAWQGLGYYRRARGLHASAVAIAARHGGKVPATAAALRELPGIGPYTAAAVAAIAFGEAVVPIDGNVARVLARLLAHDAVLTPAKAELQPAAAALADAERAGDLAQALMELGALVCTPRRPACGGCPWAFACRALAAGRAEALPARAAKTPRPTRHAVAMLIRDAAGRLCLRRRPDHGLLAGLIELPTSSASEPPVPERGRPPRRPAARRLAPAARNGAARLHPLRPRARPRRGPAGECRSKAASSTRSTASTNLALPTLTRKLLRHAGIEP
jgi:A/G-specific adenine glycosylase